MPAVNIERFRSGLPVGSSLPYSVDGRSSTEGFRCLPLGGFGRFGSCLPSLGFWCWLCAFGLPFSVCPVGVPLALALLPSVLVVLCVLLPALPAAGNRNSSSLNNAGSNGNYWSSTPNSSNTNNAYNLNFNSGNVNRNNNNRYNGQSVRPVSELTSIPSPRPSLFTTHAGE